MEERRRPEYETESQRETGMSWPLPEESRSCRTTGLRTRFSEAVRQNLIPFGLIGSGIAFMALRNRMNTGAYLQVLGRCIREYPRASGLTTLLSGVGVGLLFRRTDSEDRFFGPSRDRLLAGLQSELSNLRESFEEGLDELTASFREEQGRLEEQEQRREF